MKFAALALICFLAVLPLGYALKCYQCADTDKNCDKDKLTDDSSKEMTCPSGMDRCMRAWNKPKDSDVAGVIASCANQALCDATKKAADDKCDGKCAVGCCDTDLCNGASPSMYSLLIISLCSALGLILSM